MAWVGRGSCKTLSVSPVVTSVGQGAYQQLVGRQQWALCGDDGASWTATRAVGRWMLYKYNLSNQGYNAMANCMHCKINSLCYSLTYYCLLYSLTFYCLNKIFPFCTHTHTTSSFHVLSHIHLCFIATDVSLFPHASILAHSQAPPSLSLLTVWLIVYGDTGPRTAKRAKGIS